MMSNEEINILINIHIEELERELQENDASKRRLIKALKQAAEIVQDEGERRKCLMKKRGTIMDTEKNQ